MIEVSSQDAKTGAVARIGSQRSRSLPGCLSSLCWASAQSRYGALTPAFPPNRSVSLLPANCRFGPPQASEQLVEKTKGLEATQQESIDQLQVVQDQLQTVKRLLSAQQADAKRLSEQVCWSH